MNNNVRIAKQLVKLAKELVSEKKERKASLSWWIYEGLRNKASVGGVEWKEIKDFDEMQKTFENVANSLSCTLDKQYFDKNKPYVVLFKGENPVAVMNFSTSQFKDLNDNKVQDEDVKKVAARLLFAICWVDREKFNKECTGDFADLAKYADDDTFSDYDKWLETLSK